MTKRNIDDLILHKLSTDYRQIIYSKFLAAINKYKLIKDSDSICVCISGGKDSMLLAECFKLYKIHSKTNFDVKYIVMNPGYEKKNLDLIKHNLKILKINAEIIGTDIFEIAYMQNHSPCYLCAKMRRGALYRIAKDKRCNKIALGHHYDDVIETTLMNMLYSGTIQTMLPKLHSDNYEGMELIRPLYFVREKNIIMWSKENNLTFLNCACKFTKDNYTTDEKTKSKRLFTNRLITELSKDYDVDKNIFSATNKVNLDKVLGYKKNGIQYNYIDEYDDIK